MKKNYLYTLIACLSIWACDDQWDSHYSNSAQEVNNEELSIVDSDLLTYLKSSDDFSGHYALLQSTGVADRISAKNQGFTLLAYPDAVMQQVDDIDSAYFATTCVCDLPYLPSHLTDGARLLVWNGKYLKVTVNEEGILFNDVPVNRIVKAKDGYIYVMDAPIYAPKSLYEQLSTLNDEYSIFREMILSQNTKQFDPANSTPVGVDKTGSTVYDSVFITSNPLFDKLNISNEYINGTMFIPSNEIIREAVVNACATQQASLGKRATAADTTKYLNWIWQSMFYNRKYTVDNYTENVDIKSVYSNVWRTTVQDIAISKPIECSNGVAYYVTKMRIPNNMIVWRIKNYFKYWSYCDATQKDEYYKWTNVDPDKVEVKENFNGAGRWSPDPKNWPYISNDFLWAEAIDEQQPIALDFKALALEQNDGKNTPVVAMIPPGEYTLAMGFDDGNKKTAYTVAISVWDAKGVKIFDKELKLDRNVNCDRTGGGYAEGYPSGLDTKYDRDGAAVGTITFPGDELQPMTIRIETVGLLPSNRPFTVHHWCLRPTSNNY